MRYCHDYFILLVVIFLLSAGCANPQPNQVSANSPIVSIPGINGLDGDEEQAILSYHNGVRASVNVPPLHWSKTLSKHAATWGATLATQGCSLRPSQDSTVGENLFMTPPDKDHQAVIDAVKSWASEKSAYSEQSLTKANLSAVAHYTQMVWSITSTLGCAKVACNNQLIVICHYSPRGNQLGAKPY
jgi:pathogenesis-related protein 1